MTSLLVKIYYPRNEETEVREYKNIAEAVSDLRGENYEIGFVIEVEHYGELVRAGTEIVETRNLPDELHTTWIETERAELEEEYHRTNPKDITLEAFKDRATGPVFRKPSVRSPKIYSGGFGVAHELEAAE